MKLYSKYLGAIKEAGELKKTYFTSFNMDIEFVEKYILPPLISEDIPDNKYSLEDLNSILMSKKTLDIKFFYDLNMLISHNKKTLVKTYPVFVKNGGVFHPKVIYLEGTKKSYLFVGSGNLTISGWGRNIEAFDIVEVISNSELHNGVLDFFDDVFQLAGLARIRKTKRVTLANEVSSPFVYSSPLTQNTSYLKSLELKTKLQIYSPYFSDNLKELFERDEFKTLEAINIVPDLMENQRIRTTTLPDDKRIQFFSFEKKNINEQEPFNHSKIWISETKVGIGSYNCTKEALFGKNFEAALVRDYQTKSDFNLLESNLIAPAISTVGFEKDDVLLTNFTELYILTADYNSHEITLCKVNEVNGKYILLPSMSEYIQINKIEKLTISERLSIFRALLRNKIFKIKDKSDKIVFEGIILEENAASSNRAANNAETLDDVFLSFLDEKNPTLAKHLEKRQVNLERYDEDEYKRKQTNNIVNYYSMFLGFKNLQNKLEKIKKNNEQMRSFCYTSACSVEVIKEILTKKKEAGSLFFYLTILELNSLIKKINKLKMEKIKMDTLKNIDIKLSQNDEKFISRFIK